MPQFTIRVSEVTQRVVNKKAGGTATIYQILDEFNNKWETWNQDVAKEANRMLGQTAEIMGEIEQNGQYTNRKINDIRLATNSQQRADREPPPYTPAEQARLAQPTSDSEPIMRDGDQGPTEKDFRIGRQTAAKVSAAISGNDPTSFWKNLDPLVTYFIYGLMPPQYAGSNELQREPVRQANEFIPETAYADPGSDPTKPETWDDGIPF